MPAGGADQGEKATTDTRNNDRTACFLSGLRRPLCSSTQIQKVGGVFTHKSQVSVRPEFFQRCAVELSK